MGEILHQGFLEAGVPAERILPGVFGEEEAIDRALRLARRGDLLVVFGDKLDRSWRQITSFEPTAADVETGPRAVRSLARA